MPSPGFLPTRWIDALSRDVRHAIRSLLRAKGFSLAVIGTLVVCIGPNTAVLSVLHALVLKALPFPDARELVVLTNVAENRNDQVGESSWPQYQDFKENADLFAGFAVVRHLNITLQDNVAPMRVETDHVSIDYFDVLGVKPLRGRFFDPEEGLSGNNNVLVLAYDFWVSQYNGDEDVIGRDIRADGTTFTIIGVAPRSLSVLSKPTRFFRPYVPVPFRTETRFRYLSDCTLIARLKSGVKPEAGFTQLMLIEQRFRDEAADARTREAIESAGYRIDMQPLRPGEVRDELQSLWLLQAGALLVLVIGGVNVINLYLARMNARRSELAVRVALGAGRATLLRQVVVESTILTGIATILGIGVAMLAVHIFNQYLPIIVRTAPEVSLDLSAVALILPAMMAVAIGVGLLPHILVWRSGLQLGGARGATRSGTARVVSGVLVTVQVAVAVVLLVGAGLLIRSFARVTSIDPGFDAANIVQGRIALHDGYDNADDMLSVRRRIHQALHEIPGVVDAANMNTYPLQTRLNSTTVTMRGDSIETGENRPQVCLIPVSPGYFSTMGMRLLDGRDFNDNDSVREKPVLIVDTTFVERYFPDRLVVGQEVWVGGRLPEPGQEPVWPRIIGVVNRANLGGLEQYKNVPFAFFPFTDQANNGFNILVRSPRPTSEVLRDIREKLREIDPTLPLYIEGSMQEGLDAMLMPRRGIMLLLATFSGLALVLAAIGLYGVLAYDVSQRTREIGIRGALGAPRASIINLVLRQSLWKTGIGLLLGLGGGFALSRSMQSLLFEVTPLDPVAYFAVCMALSFVAALASWLPARRAAAVDPVIALRAE